MNIEMAVLKQMMWVFGSGFVIGAFIFYGKGKVKGYFDAKAEIDRQNTARAFSDYINQMAKEATNG
jgi:hypothetical protein